MIELTDPRWADRPKSNLINWLLKNSNVKRQDLMVLLATSRPYFETKMSLNRFSLEDILLAADLCNFSLALVSKKDHSVHELNFREFVGDISEQSERFLSMKRAEYDQLKEKAKKLEEEFGFK